MILALLNQNIYINLFFFFNALGLCTVYDSNFLNGRMR